MTTMAMMATARYLDRRCRRRCRGRETYDVKSIGVDPRKEGEAGREKARKRGDESAGTDRIHTIQDETKLYYSLLLCCTIK